MTSKWTTEVVGTLWANRWVKEGVLSKMRIDIKDEGKV